MKNRPRVCLLGIVLFILPQLTGCLATTDTARIKKGLHHAYSAEVIRIDYQEVTPHWEDISPWHIAHVYRPSYGFMLGENFGFELGLKIGSFSKAGTGWDVTRSDEGIWEKKYFPYSSYYAFAIKNYLKVGLMQTKLLKAAVVSEFVGVDPALFGIIVSKEGERTTPYLSLKTFNRFISDVDKSYSGSSWGQMLTAGLEIKTQKKFIGVNKKINLLVELGIMNDYWYHDKITKMLGIGIALR